jgi:RHS repeat-associated protein
MPDGNPLVAAPQETTNAVTGIGIAEACVDIAGGVSDGSWVEAGLGVLGAGLEVLSMVIDPLGTLASYGVSWLIEHVRPLKEALDWFAGDPPVIRSFSETWGNVAAEVENVVQEYGAEAAGGTAGWTGTAADSYRGHATQTADALAGAGTLADGISAGVMIMGEVVAFVREFIRDMVGELVGRLIAWAAEVAATLGLATPAVVAQATAAITKVVNKVADVVRKLVKTIGNVSPRIRKIIDKLDEIFEKLAKLTRRADGHAPGTTSPSSATSPSHAPDTHAPDAPDTTPSGTHPDGTGPDGSTTPAGSRNGDSPSTSDSPNRPKDPERESVPEEERVCENDPIDVVTGDMVLAHDDIELPGVLPLALRRTHVSSYRAGISFGRTWASTVDQRLEVDGQGVIFLAEDGMTLVYPDPAEGDLEAVFPVAGPRWALSRTANEYVIRPHGSVTTLHFPAGQQVCPLAAITDDNDNRIDFDRDAGGAVTAVRHSGGYRLDAVRAAGHLAGFRMGEVSLVQYAHDTDGRLTEVTNSSGRPMRFDYDHAGRLTKWTDRNGEWYRYVYDAQGRCVANEGSGGFLNGTFTYADDRTTFTDALGNATTYRINEHHRVVEITDGLGHTTTQEWDGDNRLAARTDPLGHTTRFTYDDTGNLVATTRPDGAQALAEYDPAGRVTAFVAPDGATWRHEYDQRGNLVTDTDPTGVVTRYTVNEHGHRVAITDALGNVRRIETNPAGLPLAVVDPNGARTRYDRDIFGRVTAVTDPLGRITRCAWTVEGRMLSLTRPDGGTERWRYDPEGNEVEHVDALGNVTRTRTTHFNLPTEETRPDGSTFRFAYDEALQLVSVTNAAGLTWEYTYDAAGNVVAERDFNGRELTYRHDAMGRLVERTNGAGQTVRLTRDALGRITERRGPDVHTRYSYDLVGRIERATGDGAELTFTRDAAGRVLTETVNGRTVSSTYDPLGRRIGRRTPTGMESRWGYDGASRPAQVAVGRHTMSFRYDAAGQEIGREVDDLVLTQAWDVNRRLVNQAMTASGGGAVVRRSYHYQGAELSAVDDAVAPRRYGLDRLGRVTSVEGPQWTERYGYSATGNLASDATSAGTLTMTARDADYSYDRQGRVVLRRRKRLSHKPDLWRYQWNSDDRLVGVTTPDGVRWTYLYDPLGRRIAKQRHAADGSVAERIDFAWDGSVLVEQTHSAGHTTSWEYDTASFRPLAQTERVRTADQTWVDQRFYAIVTDIVGTPTELVDEHGTVAWQGRANLWGDGVGAGTASTPLRFPGQYFDPESGLHYNYLRHYDPVSASYVSPDPLGLFGGPSPHGYVHNPTGWTDALGLTESNGQEFLDPEDINFSQRTVTENSYADAMRAGEWDWDRSPIHVMEVDGQLVSYDNRRLNAAREAGVPVRVERVNPNDVFPDPQTGQPTRKTWAQKFQDRYRDPRNRGPNGEPVPDQGLRDRPTALPPGACGGRGRRRR